MLEKKYGIFIINKGNLLGYVEDSFSMSWSVSYVRAWTLEDLKYIWDNHYDGKKFCKGIKCKYPKAFIVKITDNHPVQFKKKLNRVVEINWKERQRILNRTDKEQKEKYISKKYHRRNVEFKVLN